MAPHPVPYVATDPLSHTSPSLHNQTTINRDHIHPRLQHSQHTLDSPQPQPQTRSQQLRTHSSLHPSYQYQNRHQPVLHPPHTHQQRHALSLPRPLPTQRQQHQILQRQDSPHSSLSQQRQQKRGHQHVSQSKQQQQQQQERQSQQQEQEGKHETKHQQNQQSHPDVGHSQSFQRPPQHHIPAVHPQTHALTHHLSHPLSLSLADTQSSPHHLDASQHIQPTHFPVSNHVPQQHLALQRQQYADPSSSVQPLRHFAQQQHSQQQQHPQQPQHPRQLQNSQQQPQPHQQQHQGQHSVPCSLSTEDISVISQTYLDVLSLLRDNAIACQWFFQWVLDPNLTLQDASRVDPSRGRGFRSMHVCVAAGCASFESHTILQKSATLLIPVETHDTIVLGYFVDSSTDQAQFNLPRIGKYIYCTDNHQLLRVSKVRGPLSASHLSSVLINKTALFNDVMFVCDYVMASFAWTKHDSFMHPPARYIVHSRSFSFQKLVQAVPRASLGGRLDALPYSSPLIDAEDDMGILDNSFFGLGTFGVYEATLVPARIPPDAQTDSLEVPLSIGKWAIPDHCTGCRSYQAFHLGLLRIETSALKAQFAQAFSPANNFPPIRPISAPAAMSYPDASPFGERTEAHGAEALSLDQRMDESLAFEVGNDYGQRSGSGGNGSGGSGNFTGDRAGVVPALEAAPLPAPRQIKSPMVRTGQNALPIAMAPTGHDGIEKDMTTDGNNIMKTGTAPLQQFHTTSVDDVLNDVPSTVVETIDEVVQNAQDGGQARSDAVGYNCTAAMSFVHEAKENAKLTAIENDAAFTGPQDGTDSAPSEGKQSKLVTENCSPGNFAGDSLSKENKSLSTSAKPFKRTLPAPTKSEIVIRNRISAQRSNEKRRRKIEATKSELAYLKMTYLPHLELRRGTLISENETLRLRFMEKYHENEIDSFF